MKLLFRFCKNLVFLILNFLGRCVPRNNKIWLYGGFGKRFIDNSKYLFLNLNDAESDIKHIWMTDSYDDYVFLRSKGFLCYRRKSIKGMIISLRAKVFIYSCYPNDVNSFAFSGGAYLFNLWHGIPLKKIEYNINTGPLGKKFNPKGIDKLKAFFSEPAYFDKSDSVLCPLESFKEIFKGAFRLDDENICLAGYPRTESFFWSESRLLNHIEKYEPQELKSLILRCKNYKKVWIYMPTWRDADPDFINKAISNFNELDEVCNKNNTLFLLKLHLATKINVDITQFKNIVLVPNHFDVYPLLPFTTTLLTDYSSIFFDYQLLNKKMVFYPFDLESYLSTSREMYFRYDDLVVGDKIYSFKELISSLDKDNEFVNMSHSDKPKEFNGYREIASFIKRHIGS